MGRGPRTQTGSSHGSTAQKEMAVAVCNGHEPDERMYLPLDAADKPQKILAGWLTQAPEGVRREVAGEVWKRWGGNQQRVRDAAGAFGPCRRYG